MKQYLDTVSEVLETGVRKENRTGIDTLSTFNINYEIDMQEGFPLLTTKEISWKNIVVENLWFLSGDTDIGLLKKHGCRFWDPWADEDGQVPSAYGNFWRHFPVHENDRAAWVDQVGWVAAELQRNPMSRLPPCHALWALNVQNTAEGEQRLCLHLTQRSCDVALGVPYNIAGYAFLLALFSRFSGIEAGTFAHTLVDAHVYTSKPDGSQAEYDHVPGLREQLTRVPGQLPTLHIDESIKSLDDITHVLDASTDELLDLFRLENYQPFPESKFMQYNEGAELPAEFRGAIVAMTAERVIGVDGVMPWHYSEDLKRFRRLTTATTVIMGRLTFDAIGRKPLPNRRNIVISRTPQDNVDTYSSLEQALASCNGPVWFIGGARIYEESLRYCDLVDVMLVPDHIDNANAVKFPEMDPAVWQRSEPRPLAADPRLRRCQYSRVASGSLSRKTGQDLDRGNTMKINIGDFAVNVEISGNENGPVVMMGHSLGCSGRMWDPQMSVLEPHYKVVRLDMRGHGLSDQPDGPYTLESLADDVIAVMDELSINRAHWVGLSIGGMYGQSLLLRYPSRFISAALCDTMSVLPSGGMQLWEERLARIAADGLPSIAEATMERWFTAPYLSDASNKAACDAVRAQLALATQEGYVSCCRAIMGLDYTERLSEITTPVALTEVMYDRIPDAELTVIDSASHISNVEQADVFNKTLVNFLAAHAKG